eukprot:6490366-Amphidinium_carterae.1
MAQWEKCVQSEVLKQYGREDLAAAPTSPQYTEKELRKLFDHRVLSESLESVNESSEESMLRMQASWAEWDGLLTHILDERHAGAGGSHQSDVDAASWQMLARHVHAVHDHEAVSRTWMTKLLPIGEIVSHVRIRQMYQVMVVAEFGALLLSVQDTPTCGLQPVCSSDALRWFCAFHYGDFEVVPTSWLSPLEAKRAHQQPVPLRQRCGENASMLHWTAHHGFARVPEGVMRSLHQHLEVGLPDTRRRAGLTVRQCLAMNLINAILPAASQSDAVRFMSTAYNIEHPNQLHHDHVPQHALEDLVLQGERQDVEKHCLEAAKHE